MKYLNPIIPGFNPDPSICTDGKKFYLVTSTFQYFPGVALYESENLIEWTMIGNVLTGESQLPLEHSRPSDGIYAPVIRYNEGRFYMITTNVSDGGNFIVYTDDIHGEWSDPIPLTMGGIDPSLSFIDGKCYFTGCGADEAGRQGVVQCELDIKTGKPLTPVRLIWYGAGGRYLEGPHLYKIGKYYYLMAAEGGTEYGHMTIYARSEEPFGPFENYAKNPVITNRNLGGYEVQGVGHADLIRDLSGNWWMVHLAFRQVDKWLMQHTIGRETYLVPVEFSEDGWFTAGTEGTTRLEVERTLRDSSSENDRDWTAAQAKPVLRTFENTRPGREWVFVRNPQTDLYRFESFGQDTTGKTDRKACLTLKGNGRSHVDAWGTSSFTAIRQEQMHGSVSVKLELKEGPEAGLSVYMDHAHHYDLAVRTKEDGETLEVLRRVVIGDADQEQKLTELSKGKESQPLLLQVELTPMEYRLSVVCGGETLDLGSLQARYLSTEVAGGFTGVMLGLYADKEAEAVFTDFRAEFVRKASY